MKNTYKVMAVALAMGAVSVADAQTIVRITGSTAFRKATIVGIQNKMGGAGVARGAFTGSSITGGNQAILRGNIAGVGDTIFKCSWSGAVGGVQTVVQNLNVPTWLDSSQIPGSAGTYTALSSPTFDPAVPADVTMADSKQSATGFNSTPALTVSGGQPVGIIAFQWVANSGSPAGLNNISPLQAQQLATSLMSLSQFTGNPADATVPVYMVGRNFDSGTRLVTLAEAGIGVFGSIQQIQPVFNTGSGGCASTVTGLKLWPAETVLGIPFDEGQSGYGSGGNLADSLASAGSSTANGSDLPAGWLIGYMGINDAARATGADGVNPCSTAHVLKWNGEDYSVANVQEGKYTFWNYEFMLYRSTFTGLQKTAADAVAVQIRTVDGGQSGVLFSSMHVSRQAEGGVISHN